MSLTSARKIGKSLLILRPCKNSNPSTFSSLSLHRPNVHCTTYANTVGTMPGAGFCKPSGTGLKPMTAKCLTHTRHDRGSKSKLLPICAGTPAGFGGYVPIPTPCTSLMVTEEREGREGKGKGTGRKGNGWQGKGKV